MLRRGSSRWRKNDRIRPCQGPLGFLHAPPVPFRAQRSKPSVRFLLPIVFVMSPSRPLSPGLSAREVDESRRLHGSNVITPPREQSPWALLFDKFRDPVIKVLLAAAVLSLVIGCVQRDFTESVGILCAIVLATCVGVFFE